MNTTEAVNPTQTTVVKKHKVILGAFGDGRYSQAMKEVFNDSQRLFSLSPIQSHVVAERLGVDAGQLMSASVKLKFGSASKDGHRSLKEITKAMKIKESWAMTVGYLCAEVDSLRKEGLVVKSLTLDDNILASINIAAERVEV